MLTLLGASAGSGKTFNLAKTYILLLFGARRSANPHRRILAVTFTKKATDEMKKRIVQELYLLATGQKSNYKAIIQDTFEALKDDTLLQQEAQTILFQLVQDYGAFGVNTIDSFFQQVVRAFARELGLSGKYNLELDSDAILQMAVDDFFAELPSDGDSFKTLLDIVEDNIAAGKKWNPKETLFELSRQLLNEQVILNHQQLFDGFLNHPDKVKAYRDDLRAVINAWKDDYAKAVQTVRNHIVTEKDYGANVLNLLKYDFEKAVKGYKENKLPATLFKFIAEGKCYQVIPIADQAEVIPALQKICYLLSEEPMRDVITAQSILQQLPYLTLLSQLQVVINKTNAELNRLPIAETNTLLNDVIAANEESPFIYEKIGTRIRHFLIDEFQDTSYMQWNNFKPLISESLGVQAENLVVGDIKQSIYRWRNSDYTLMYKTLPDTFNIEPTPLQDNWRSAPNIVNFNNYLFATLPTYLQLEYAAVCPNGKGSLTDIYSDSHQTSQADPKKGKGFVEIRFSKQEDPQEHALSQLPELLEDIKRRNIPLGDVACLVRTNKECLQLAQALVEQGYKVMSNEGLLLINSAAVQFIIYSLKHLLYPNDAIIALHLNHFAKKLGVEQQSLPLLQGNILDYIQILIRFYHLQDNEAHQAYLMALQDKAYEYSTKNPSDLFSFLTWWDSRAGKFVLSMQKTEDAIQIMTVHKSKGLEFKVVIVPFCSWVKAKQRSNDLLWVHPQDPISRRHEVPLVPIKYEKGLLLSYFNKAYEQELFNQYLDNLNVTYVAFTRPVLELYIFIPQDDKGIDKIGHTMRQILKNESLMALEEGEENDIYTLGEKQRYEVKEKDHEPSQSQPIIKDDGILPPLALHLPSRDFEKVENEAQRRGIITHTVLQTIKKQGDEKDRLDELCRQGVIREHEAIEIQRNIDDFWALLQQEGKMEWFDTSRYDILTEQDILLVDTDTPSRPDRILLDYQNNKAIVIDYKTGKEHSSYFEQVRDYMSILSQMGYETEGYLCYIMQHKIVSV